MKEKKQTGKKKRWIWAVVAAVLVIGAWGSRNGGSETPTASPTPTVEQVRAIETPAPTPQPSVAPTPVPTPRPSVEPTPEPTRSYVINKNSHVFHYEWCSAVKKMSEKNRVPFEGTRTELLEQGYDPCDICKP